MQSPTTTMTTTQTTMPMDNKRAATISNRQMHLRQTLSKLPTNIRESIHSSFKLAISEHDVTLNEMSVIRTENQSLKSELHIKSKELANLFHLSNRLKQQILELENAKHDLTDKLTFKSKFMTINHRNTITGNYSLNESLMNCLDSLQGIQNRQAGPSVPVGMPPVPPHNASLNQLASSLTRKNHQLENKVHELSVLLKHWKHECDTLQMKVNSQRIPPPLATTDEVFIAKKRDFDAHDQKFQILLSRRNIATEEALLMLRRLIYQFSSTVLANSNSNNNSNNTSSMLDNTIRMITSHETLQVFEVERIVLFLSPFVTTTTGTNGSEGGDGVNITNDILIKHTSMDNSNGNSNGNGNETALVDPEQHQHQRQAYHRDNSPCLAFDTMKHNETKMHNNYNDIINNTSFHPVIDGCSLNVANVLAVPINGINNGNNKNGSKPIGCLLLLNKRAQGRGFTEFDTIFASIFSRCCCGWLDAAFRMQQQQEQISNASRFLHVSNSLYKQVADACFPDLKDDSDNNSSRSNSDNGSNNGLTPESVISIMESVASNALSINTGGHNVKVFLPSEVLDMEPGMLLFLETKLSNRLANGKYLKACKNDVGLMGDAFIKNRVFLVDGLEADVLCHSEIDLDPIGCTVVSTPIRNLREELIAGLQVVLPKTSHHLFAENPNCPEQAVQNLIEQLAQQMGMALDQILQVHRSRIKNVDEDEQDDNSNNSDHEHGNDNGGKRMSVRKSTMLDFMNGALDDDIDKAEASDSFDDAADDDSDEAIVQRLNDEFGYTLNAQKLDVSFPVLRSLNKLLLLTNNWKKKKQLAAPDAAQQVNTFVQDAIAHMKNIKPSVATRSTTFGSITDLSELDEGSIQSYKEPPNMRLSRMNSKFGKSFVSRKSVSSMVVTNTEGEMLLKTNKDLRTEVETLREEAKQKDALILTLQSQLIDYLSGKIREPFEIATDPASFNQQYHGVGESGKVSLASQTSQSSWLEQQDEYGRTYYVNATTGESAWEKPIKQKPSAPLQPMRVGDWLQQFDANGNGYWLNVMTGVSEWSIPPPSRHFVEK